MGEGEKKSKKSKKAKPKKLTPKQEVFTKAYVKDLNAGKAAIEAGYSEASARSIGHELLNTPHVKEAVQKEVKKRLSHLDVTADRVLTELARIAFVDLRDAYGEGGKLLPPDQMPEDLARALAGIEVNEIWEGYGDEREIIGETKKIKFYEKAKALELLGKYLKLFTDRVEHTGKDGEPISFVQFVATYGDDGEGH
jgi:phage terminase small subunit